MYIGIYNSIKHPFETMPEERKHYLAAEAKMQGCEVVFFNRDGVDYNTRTVNGYVSEDGDWVFKNTPFPDVLIDEYVKLYNRINGKEENTINEKLLAADIPLIRYGLPGKNIIYSVLEKSDIINNHLIPYWDIKKANIIFDLLKEKDKLVIKPRRGKQGKGIIFIEKKEDGFLVRQHEKFKFYKKIKFKYFIVNLISKSKYDYIAQPYIKAMTKKGNPYDFRVHMQRGKTGEWDLTKIYPRIGSKDSILSNISRGGMSTNIDYFLYNEFDENREEIKNILIDLSFDIVKFIDKAWKREFDELGVDLAIDEDANIWIFEVNALPQTRYHEAERAKNTIGYAKYYAEKAKSNELYNKMRDLNELLNQLLDNIISDFENNSILNEDDIFSFAKSFSIIERRLAVRYSFLNRESNIKELTKMVGTLINSLVKSIKEENGEEAVKQFISLCKIFDKWSNELDYVIERFE